MRTKRINTELYDTITVTDKSGNAIDFSTAYDIYLYLQKQGSSSLLKQDFALNGNTLSYQFNSDENNRGLGIYDLHLEWKKKNANSELTYDQYHFDYLGCFKEVYASACWDNTDLHEKAIKALPNAVDKVNYDFTVGYPTKQLEF